MPFRERAKKIFRSKSRGSSLSKTSTSGSDRDRWPSNVYKPGEPMPRPKYRAAPQKEHKEKLEAFSFADAWRKKSFQSTYSPMGTRAPSRRTSFLSMGRRSISGRSTGRKSFSGRSTGGKSESGRTGSVTSIDTEKSTKRTREGTGHKLEGQPEAEGDDDVGNVGLSRVQSRDQKGQSRPHTADEMLNGAPNGLYKTKSTAHDHHPFTEQDLQTAMQRSRLQVPAH